MKKLILITLLALSGSVFAQGNLQFNAVKYFTFSVTQPNSVVHAEQITNITVPANKVWKIESANSSYIVPAANYASIVNGGRILIDGRVIWEAYSSSSTIFYTPTLPMWLPAGSYTLSMRTSATSNGYQYVGSVTAIEFNIVP